jgi:TrmH family RNA methyltransferase
VVEGATLIAEAVEAGWRLECEFVAPGGTAVGGGPVAHLAEGVVERVATTEHPQPNLGLFRMPTTHHDLAVDEFVVMADQLADPGNLGTLLRSAEASGAHAVVLTAGSVDPFNPKVVRASAGALFHVPVVTAELDDLRDAGFRLIGSSSHEGRPHTEIDWSGRVALVLGNEARGLAPDAPVDEWVTIRHAGRAESLNVAMAGTVLCFEAARYRNDATLRRNALDPSTGEA